jgi:hypothetical protein
VGGVRVNPPRGAKRKAPVGGLIRIGVAAVAVKPTGGRLTSRPVGSKGKKPRKPQHSQHLPKAGTKADNQRLLHEEHGAILDTMGMGNAGKGARTALWVVGALFLVCAIVALIILVTF